MFLFCASDAGGARELIPVIEEAKKHTIACHVLCSPVTAPLFSHAGVEAEECTLSTMTEAENLLKDEEIQVLLVGTTGTIHTEQYLTAAAKKLSIPSIAVLDEWFDFTTRFEDENGELGLYLPDLICVQDETSYTLAKEEGLPVETLRITGNPALAALALRARAFAENPPEIPKVLQVSDSRPSLLFLSQPLKKAYGVQMGDSGTQGAFIGYQEDIVRDDLAELLSAVQKEVLVVEKPHPSEKPKPPPLCAQNVQWCVHAEKDPIWPLLWHADIIVGMSTKALMEAAILGRHPISYQPNAVNPCICTAVRLNLAELHMTKESIAKKLPILLEVHERKAASLPTFPFANPDAACKVLAMAREFSS